MAATATFLAVAVRMLMMDMVSNRIGKVLRAREWRWYDARELGDQERGRQHAHESLYRPEPLHQRCLCVDDTSHQNRSLQG